MDEATGIVLQWLALYLMFEVALEFSHSRRQFRLAWSDPAAALSFAIFLHFVAGILDGTYWQMAWSAKYHAWQSQHWLFENGIISNIPFRHLLPILVALLHLRSIALKTGKSMAKYYFRSAFVVSLALVQVSLG